MSIYQSTSIAGVCGEDLTGDLFRKLGRSLATLMGEGMTIVVAGDARPGAPELKAALIEGLVAGGRIVADAGITATPVAAFAGRMLRSDAAAIVTGLNGPPSQGGLVLSRSAGTDVAADLGKLRELMAADLEAVSGGEVESWEDDIADEYAVWLRDAVPPADAAAPLRVVADAGNEKLADLLRELLEAQRNIELELLFDRTDGSFPGRGPDLSAAGALDPLCGRVQESNASLGVAFDAGGSRVRFVDEKGSPLSPEAVAVLLLRGRGSSLKGGRVVVDARTPRFVLAEIKALGAQAVIDRDEPAFLRQRVISEQAAFGVGVEGTYLHGELQGDADGIYTALRVLEMLRDSPGALSGLVGEPVRPVMKRDIRVPCDPGAARAILSRIRAAFPREAQTEVEGIRVRLEDGWAAVLTRASDETISFSFEGDDEDALVRITEDIIGRSVEVREEARRLAGLPDLPPPDPYAYLDEKYTD